ncbi:MAG: MBL fold metallo-hydrolase [Anaerolineales bacterium]|nr:MBL fold metallo-hydrolase [Anaerolineales bacterium]
MRVTNLTQQSKVYTSNVFLIRGDWNTLKDVNTLIDVGNDPSMLERLRETSTGVGKCPVEQAILTHGHFDHVSILPIVRKAFNPIVYAHSKFVGADQVLEDGQTLHCGDRTFEVIFTPGHSSDSICLYCEQDGVLFSGDAPIIIRSHGETYEAGFVQAMEKICQKDVRAIYFGHGNPLLENCNSQLANSLRILKNGSVIAKPASFHVK